VKFMDWNGLRYSAPAQNTWTPSFNQKRKNHSLGVRPGLPDLMIYISPDNSKDGLSYILHIEMKRAKKSLSKVSPEQQQWHDSINAIGSPQLQAYICYGADEAIKVISHYLCKVDNSVF
ncbi:MAG TPA: VRR-NUC domain-containing protein, partial [Pseudomonadales bacterium]|nr:VRR-NUC domain-containing protein [Pseudomonadales bacterium]